MDCADKRNILRTMINISKLLTESKIHLHDYNLKQEEINSADLIKTANKPIIGAFIEVISHCGKKNGYDMHILRSIFSAFIILMVGTSSYGQVDWAKNTLDSMSLDEKIGQLFMVAAYSNRGDGHETELKSLVQDYHIGGIIFFQGTAEKQAAITNELQSLSKVPMMIGMDSEWGLNMRLDDVDGYPKQMTLGATRDSLACYEMGKSLGEQCRRLGVNVCFSPVVDVNINPKNPVIGIRSFGQNKENVARLGGAMLNGIQDAGVLACAKHFPGHGDTEFDSHKTLPAVIATKDRIDSVELYPYRKLIDNGLRSVMAAHLHLPALHTHKGIASSLSPEIISGLLRDKMGFDGLVFTDALNMKGVSQYFGPGELEYRALMAGNDVLLFSEDVPKAIAYIKQAVLDGKISQEVIDVAVSRILNEKKNLKLTERQSIVTDNLISDLNKHQIQLLTKDLYAKSITLLKNDGEIIPFKQLDTVKIAAISIGNDDVDNEFLYGLTRYARIDRYAIAKKPSEMERQDLMDQLYDGDYTHVIIGIHGYSVQQKENYGIPAQVVRTVRDINEEFVSSVCVFANPYSLNLFYGLKDVPSVVMAYEDNPNSRDIASQLIMGGLPFKGKLPVDASVWFKEGVGIGTEADRFKYGSPLDVGLDLKTFAKIDALMNNGIKEGAYPGGQLLVAKDGVVIHHKGYGHHTYDKSQEVRVDDIYDLASVTKICATTASVMRLSDENKISVDSTLGKYIHEYTKSTAYENVVLREMMTHQAGFFTWLPFYRKTMNKHELDWNIYSKVKDAEHDKKVADDLYIHHSWRDSILMRIMREPISYRKKYKYSDFGFYLLHKAIENITSTQMEDYVDSVFYKPLGLSTMTYNPLEKFDASRIAPTENDTTFRKQQIRGYVHDQGAAMMGGISGHAGLFSNVNDLGIMMQMFMNEGHYGYQDYISDSTLNRFTSVQYRSNGNRRGIGFDKPVLSGGSGPTCHDASPNSFGHTGFTGITAWADPDDALIYIFVSNRVYPIAENKKILRLNVRTDIQQLLYDAIKKSKENGIN